MTSGGGGPISEVPKPPRGKLSWRSKTSGDCSWEISWYRNLMKFMSFKIAMSQEFRDSGLISFFLWIFSGWQMMWGDMTSFPKTPRWCKPLLLYLLFGFGDILIWEDMPNFYIFHYYLWLWGSPHSKMQMPLLRKLHWRETRASLCAESPEIWKFSLLYIRIDSEMGWFATQTQTLLWILYYLYIYIYTMITLHLIWRVHTVHTLTMGLCKNMSSFRLGPFDWRSSLEYQSHQIEEA